MKETLNPTTDLELQSHIKVSCEIFSKIDGESSTLTGQKETLFHAFAWETEALWQFLRVLIDDMDRPLTDTVEANTWLALFAATGLVLGATYMLWLYRRVMFGQVVSAKVQSMERMQLREYGIFLPLTILVLFFGVYPMALLDVMDVSIQFILDDLTASGVALLAAR